jgi:hypothetical protein
VNGDDAKGGAEPKKAGIEAWFLKTAGTIVGGLGTAGAMVVIGSAILWVRFKEAGIPPVQAVAAQPRQEALVQGAQTTIFFVLIALAVVATLYILDFPKENGAEEASGKKDEKDKKDAKGVNPGSPRPIHKRTKRCILLLPIGGIVWLISTSLGGWWVAWLSLLALLMTAACVWVGHRADKNFWALAAAVFVAILVFAGAATYAITQAQKFVQAVAILRGQDDVGLTGYFVAVTDTKIYFANSIGVEGTTAPERKPLQSVTLNEEVTYSVGPLESQEDATARAASMQRRLISDRESAASGATKSTAANLPAWVNSDVAATFGDSLEARTEAPDTLCLMRYYSSGKGTAKGPWWTSCAEAEALASIEDVRSHFALPRRFQASYDRRVRVEIPAKTKLKYVEGDTAPQCGGAGQQPCGHRYRGGGLQYWISAPEQLGEITEQCTAAAPDEESAWHPCAN